MKGIETGYGLLLRMAAAGGSDHCPAMKGIETLFDIVTDYTEAVALEATTAPQ